MSAEKPTEAANALRAGIYYPARKLLDWEDKWHRRLLECPKEEYPDLEQKAAREISEVIYAAEGSIFAWDWANIAQKTMECVTWQRKAGKRYEDT